MKTAYFNECTSLDEVKKRYKELALQFHPDRGGDTATMQEINNAYQSILKNPIFAFTEKTEQEREEYTKYPDIIDKIIGLPGIVIELIGNWIWLSGNTYQHRKEIKEAGFYFAPKKLMWYYRPADYKSFNKLPKPIDYIRLKYGSDIINREAHVLQLS